MTKHIALNGQQFTLYRVDGYENAWCSDRRLAQRIERKRKALFRELSSAVKQAKGMKED